MPNQVRTIFLASWASKTKRQYIVYIKQWITFCVEKNKNFKKPTVKNLLIFLTRLYNKKLSYSAINIARSAISSFSEIKDCVKLGAQPIISRFMAGIKNLRPKVSRYSAIWDVDMVLKYLIELWPLEKLSLDLLSKKLVVLFLLVTSHRVQSVQALRLSNLKWVQKDLCVFLLSEKLKHIRNKELGYIELKGYQHDPRLCIIRCLKEYIKRTKDMRGKIDELIITTRKPYRAAHHATIGKWVMSIFRDSGVDDKSFKPHSVRSATTSKYLKLNISVDKILKKADWSSEGTFRRYYDKQILPSGDISQEMLNAFLKNNRK